MNTIGNTVTLPVLTAAPKVSVPQPRAAQTALPEPVRVEAQQPDVRTQAVREQQEVRAVRRAAEQIANPRVLGTDVFVMFKDATGQFITRRRDTVTGQVSYEPEPELTRRHRVDLEV